MEEKIRKWLALTRVPDLGTVGIRKLWEHFGSIEEIWKADQRELDKIENLSQKAASALIESKGKTDLGGDLPPLKDIEVLTLEDDEYPKNLKNIYDPPPILYVKGKIAPQDQKAIAIVGTRKASHYGKSITRKLASELTKLGITIVSGMALGIDSAAHEGALEAKGRTIAVLGCGVDVVYPPSNEELMRSIISSGAVVSEFVPGTEPENWMFPQRNRIISGLSLGVIVVEGHYDSGAMITAKAALDQGREVFAVPGNVELEQSKGPHWLIKQGAKLVENVEDVLDELNIAKPMTNDQGTNACLPAGRSNEGRDYSNLSPEEQKITAVLSLEPKHIDRIALDSGLPIAQTSSLLMMLEVKGIIRQLPGKSFVLCQVI